MTDMPMLALSGGAGAALGAFFFGTLWWTVHRGAVSRRPALWFLGGMLTRTAAVLAGFYAVGGDSWERLLACLAGFIVVRLAVVWGLGGSRRRDGTTVTGGTGHAPYPR